MKLLELRALRDTPEEWDRLEKRIKDLFRTQIYLPLIFEIGAKKNVLKNSLQSLVDAITSGKIYFYRGKFTGQFNSTLSKELKHIGAQWNRKTSSWDILHSKLPVDVKMALSVSYDRFRQTARKIDRKLEDISPEEIADKLKIEHIFDASLYKVDREFNQIIKGIRVAPELTPDGRDRLSREYSENLKLKIRGWMNPEILELRQTIQKTAFEGARYDRLIADIQKSYGVSQRKATFLARQETNLLLSKFKEIRYQDAGIDDYKWRCVTGTSQHPVRPRHKQLNDESHKGKIFHFSDPPISTDPGEPIRRCNPGEDYGCRCVAIPVVRF